MLKYFKRGGTESHSRKDEPKAAQHETLGKFTIANTALINSTEGINAVLSV